MFYNHVMTINNYSTLFETKKELSRRLRAYRLSINLTQGQLSQASGVSLGAIKSFERSGTASLDTLLSLLKALSLLGNADALIPALGLDTIALHKLGHQRQRARRKAKKEAMPWGDEQ